MVPETAPRSWHIHVNMASDYSHRACAAEGAFRHIADDRVGRNSALRLAHFAVDVHYAQISSNHWLAEVRARPLP